MSWILTESWIFGVRWALSSLASSRAPAATGAGFVFALCFFSRFLVASGGVEGVDILTDDSTCPVSIFRFFLSGDFAFNNPWVLQSGDALSEAAFAIFAFAFTLAPSRRAFRAWLAFFYVIEKRCLRNHESVVLEMNQRTFFSALLDTPVVVSDNFGLATELRFRMSQALSLGFASTELSLNRLKRRICAYRNLKKKEKKVSR